MKRISASAMALLIAATLIINVYKPESHEQLSESPTGRTIEQFEPNGFNAIYTQYLDKQRQQAEVERRAKRQQALEEAHRLYDERIAEDARQRLEAERLAEQKQISRSNDANLTQLTMLATHYGPDCAGCSGITTSGDDVRSTIYYNGMRVLAAPRSIPLYTIMRVTYPNGDSFKGIVLDRGGDIVTGRLDILVASENEAYRLGKQTVTVTIIKNGKGR